jgi:hypothetical protein
MRNFSHPLRYETLLAFCQPNPAHHFAAPALIDRHACACNGFVALQAHSGLWASDDFPEPPAGFVESWQRIPLEHFPAAGAWHPLDAYRGRIYARAPIEPFTRTYRPANSPAVRVGTVNVLLSMLQLVARLPRCEFTLAQTASPTDALFFRCSGALGLIAGSSRDIAPAFTIDPVARHHDGTPRAVSTMGALPLPNWPPAEPVD